MSLDNLNIPGEKEWEGWELDPDVKFAHKLLFGKSISEVIPLFQSNPIERSDELNFVTRGVFQYYIFAFTEYLISDNSIEDSDAASSFLRLLIHRERKDPGCISEIFIRLKPIIDFVAENQIRFGADEKIYGKFSEIRNELILLFNKGD